MANNGAPFNPLLGGRVGSEGNNRDQNDQPLNNFRQQQDVVGQLFTGTEINHRLSVPNCSTEPEPILSKMTTKQSSADDWGPNVWKNFLKRVASASPHPGAPLPKPSDDTDEPDESMWISHSAEEAEPRNQFKIGAGKKILANSTS